MPRPNPQIIKVMDPETYACRNASSVQDIIKHTKNTIILWPNTSINRTYNETVPKLKSQKNDDPSIEDSVRY